jgi:hypothetical protein
MATLLMLAALSGPPIGYVDPVPLQSVRVVDHRRRVVRPYRSRLTRMAQCESNGNWHIATGTGFYGGLQFTVQSWRAVGGSGYPHWHGRLEQMFRAVKLMRIQGWAAWPVCQYA